MAPVHQPPYPEDHCARFGLDPLKLAQATAGVLAAAAQLGHKRPAATVRDYLHRGETKEVNFVLDLFEGQTDQMLAQYKPTTPPRPTGKAREPGFGKLRPR